MAKRLTVRRPVSYEDLGELLPGIANDITLHEITPKLSWGQIAKLYSTSGEWKKAIEGDIVHNVRVGQLNSEQTFAVFTRTFTRGAKEIADKRTTIWLYPVESSMRDELCFQLPPIPGVHKGYPEGCACVSVDSKIYAVGGGSKNRSGAWKMGPPYNGRRTVYMLDLERPMKWKQCAQMREPRQDFGAGVMNGKIYVFGGWSNGKLICGAEVYDPKVDSWAPIKPMVSKFHRILQVVTIGEEFFVYGSTFLDVEGRDSVEPLTVGSVEYVKIYNPATDEWRFMESFGRDFNEGLDALEGVGPELFGRDLEGGGPLFNIQGILHQLTFDGVFVHEEETHSWSVAQTHGILVDDQEAHSGSQPDESMYFSWSYFHPRGVICFENELFVDFWGHLFRIKGFCDRNKDIQWQLIRLPRVCKASPTESEIASFQCSIKLVMGSRIS